MPALHSLVFSGVSPRLSIAGVSIGPGLIAFTRIFRAFRSAVQVRAKDRTAALVALYTLNDAIPLIETIEALRMIDAPSGMRGSAFCPENNRCVVATPLPLDPPVTTATLPSSFLVME